MRDTGGCRQARGKEHEMKQNKEQNTICLLNDSFPPLIDGVSNAVVNYALDLNAAGRSAFVVTPENPDADDSGFSFPVVRYPGVDLRKKVGYVAGNPFSPEVVTDLKRRNVELFHSHCPIVSTTLARSLREVIDAPLVMTYHTKFDVDISKAIKWKILQEGALNALVDNISACDEIWVVSDGAGKNLQSIGYKGDYIVMPNGVDVPRRRLSDERARELTAGWDLPEDLPVFLFVGRLMWYKGLKIIIDALDALRSQDLDFRMVFVGGGTDAEEVKQYVKDKGLEGRVFFTGPIHDREALCAWYCRSDLFLFPSTFDTNGLVVREAAACGLASVLIKGSCAAEGVTGRRNGLLIDENAASLAVLLARVMEDRDFLRRIGRCASDELYLSWQDSVAAASRRYDIVIENYKKGLYSHVRKPSDEIFRLSADLLDFVNEVREFRSSLKGAMNSIYENMELYM